MLARANPSDTSYFFCEEEDRQVEQGPQTPPIPRISLTLSKPATVIIYSEAASAGAMYPWLTRYLAATSHSVDSGSRSALGAAPSPGISGPPSDTGSVSFSPERS